MIRLSELPARVSFVTCPSLTGRSTRRFWRFQNVVLGGAGVDINDAGDIIAGSYRQRANGETISFANLTFSRINGAAPAD